jgi:CubicO group peptidase (beta-lactamase class C family)
LAGEGKLKLDEPLLPFVEEPFSDDPRLAKVTARMVLSHTSGLPHGVADGEKVKLQFEPGAKFAYSATGFDLLQRAVAKISGLPIEEFMRERMFRPLKMERSEFIWTERLAANLAGGYDRDGKPGITFIERFRKYSPERLAAVRKIHPELSYPPAAAGLYCTATDYAKFLIEMCSPKYYAMCEPIIKITDETSWGLGWGLLKQKGQTWIWHWGNWNGLSQHFAAINRATKKGIVVLTNSGNGLRFCRDFVPEAIGLDLSPLRRFFD